jgi:polyhydroxyalkanoate synthesis regulator protein
MNNETIVVTRYANRKYYRAGGKSNGRYLPLRELTRYIREGATVQVICNKTKNDITVATLCTLLCENEKTRRCDLTAEQLSKIVRDGGGSFTGYLHNRV